MSKSGDNVILLVEDNEDDVFLMELTFKEAGVQNAVHVATDGQKAVNYLSGTGEFGDREKFPFPSLIFLDLKLPYRSGLEILEWMRAQPNLPKAFVAVLTSSNEPSDLQKAYDLGAKTYLVKPPTPEMIYDLAQGFKLDWLGCNRTRKAESTGG